MKTITTTLAIMALLLCAAPPGKADEPSVKQELKLALAKVAVNEAGFSSEADVALIYAAAGSMGTSHQTRLNFLRRHSRRVLGDRDCAEGRNCQWTRNLTWSDVQPLGWRSDLRWSPQRWARVRRWASGFVEGTNRLRACPEVPQTWGGTMDHARAVSRGLRPLGCRTLSGSLNEGYRYIAEGESEEARPEPPSYEDNTGPIPASVARGRRDRD